MMRRASRPPVLGRRRWTALLCGRVLLAKSVVRQRQSVMQSLFPVFPRDFPRIDKLVTVTTLELNRAALGPVAEPKQRECKCNLTNIRDLFLPPLPRTEASPKARHLTRRE